MSLASLSAREREVALLIAQDKSPKVICCELKLHPRTVAVYIQRTKTKLGVQSLVGVALIVAAAGKL